MPKPKKSNPKIVNLKIVPTKDQISERVYSNYVVISHSEYDFNLKFCDINPPDETQRAKMVKSGEIEAPVQVEIAIPIVLVEQLINALTIQYTKYKKSKTK